MTNLKNCDIIITETKKERKKQMTKVSYSVGNFETTSYAEALKEQETTGLGITRHYTPIPETPELDESAKAFRDKRVAFRKAQRESRA